MEKLKTCSWVLEQQVPHGSESALRKRFRNQALPEIYRLLALSAWYLYKQLTAMLELSAWLPHVLSGPLLCAACPPASKFELMMCALGLCFWGRHSKARAA